MATVLIVEDDLLSQKILAKTLSNAGHEALPTATIKEAWVQLRYYVVVDLIILDNQLKQEWGWEFLRELRKDLIYKAVPVVVYTAHTERSSLLKYVELGVQGMLVKPYVAHSVLAEVTKAVKTGWGSRLVESPEAACERLKIGEADYSYFLQTAVSVLGRSVREAQQSNGTVGAKLLPIVDRIKSESAQLGSPLFKSLITTTEEAIGNRDPASIISCFNTMDAVLGLIRQRAMNWVRLGDAVRRSPIVPKKEEVTPVPLFEPPQGMEAVFQRKMTAQPIWNFGRHFGRLRGAKLIDRAQLEKLGENLLASDPLYSFFTALKLIARVPELPVDETVNVITEVRGFDVLYLRIAAQLGFNAEASPVEENVRNAIRHQGTAKAISLVAAGRIATAGKAASPLDLRPLLEHTVAVSLLSFEIGRLLNLTDPHNLSAAGAMHDIGKWFFAIGEPALYAAALAITQAEQVPIAKAETEIFGLAHPEAGELLLQLGRGTELQRETTLYHSNPEKVMAPRLAPFVGAVHIATHVARAIQSGDEKYIATIKTSFSATHPVWAIFRRNGIEPPLDIPELVEAIFSIGQTTAWTTTVLLKGP